MHPLSEIVMSSSSQPDQSIHVWDLRSGTLLGSFKGLSPGPMSDLCLLPSPSNPTLPSHLLAPQSNAPLLQVWNLSKMKAAMMAKYVLPEPLTSFTTTHSGGYMVGGGSSGRIYVWETTTGTLLKSFDGHFKAIHSMIFTPDDSCLATGGEDSLIHLWALSSLVNIHDSNDSPSPIHTLKGHTLPVKHLTTSLLLSRHCRIFSVSLDKTCRIWEVQSGALLSTVSFPSPLDCLSVDPTELRVYVGGADGRLYASNLYRATASGAFQGLSQGTSLESGVSNTAGKSQDGLALVGHKESITSLSLSLDGSLLVSGSKDGAVIVWDTSSGQSLRTFPQHKGPITKVCVTLSPPHLLDPDASLESMPLEALKRYPKDLKDMGRIPVLEKFGLDQKDESLFVNATTPSDSADLVGPLQRKIQELESKNKELKRLNDELYKASVSKILDKA